VSQTPLLNRVLQRLGYVILPQNIIEVLGSIFSRENLITHDSTLLTTASQQKNETACLACIDHKSMAAAMQLR